MGMMQTWNSYLPEILSRIKTPDLVADPRARLVTEAYVVPSPDKQDLLFSFPIIFSSEIFDDIPLPVSGSAGGVHAIIEFCKSKARTNPALGPLYGAGTGNQSRYLSNLEPYTIISSSSCIGSGLWHPDEQNYFGELRIHLILRGAVPYRESSQSRIPEMADLLTTYAQAVVDVVYATPLSRIRQAWETTIDQQVLRSSLSELGLISFIGDGTRPARDFTRYRCWERVAGPKRGVHIPFFCPEELEPIEVHLAGSNKTITGLGIRSGELFAITGSNAQGKTSLLQAIHTGEDIHAPGDGREYLVTVPGGMSVD